MSPSSTVSSTAVREFVGWFAGVIRFLQSGYIYHYAFAMIIGMLGLLTLFVTLGGK